MRLIGAPDVVCTPLAAIAVVSLSLACGPMSESRDGTGTIVETETIGDTTVVRTVSGSVWGEDVALVPKQASRVRSASFGCASWHKADLAASMGLFCRLAKG